MATQFFTIASRSYLAHAATLYDSVKQHHPEASFTCWLVDTGEIPASAPQLPTRAVATVFEQGEWRGLIHYYTPLELCTAVKPRLFERHFAEGAGRAVYLDPDILLFRRLVELEALLERGVAGVLTPHVDRPLPRDGRLPDDRELLGSGLYNLGFLALSAHADADAMLRWWWSWLKTECFADKSGGTFTDQKWMNFCPLFWPSFSVLSDAGYNVAYWNLPQRPLLEGPEGLLVGDRPLSFFHFSGFDSRAPERLSRYDTRIDVDPSSLLGRLLGDYANRLRTHGHDRLRGLRPTDAAFDNGIPFDPIAHRAYRDALAAGLEFDDPARTGDGSFLEWLCRPVSSDHAPLTEVRLTRYLLTLYRARSDLHATLPDPFGEDRRELVDWIREHAVVEMGADPALLSLQFPSPTVDVGLLPGIEAALGLSSASPADTDDTAPIVRTHDLSRLRLGPVRGTALLTEVRSGGMRPASWINLLPVDEIDRLPVGRTTFREFLEQSYNVIVWTLDAPRFPPSWSAVGDLIDEIWAPTPDLAAALAPEVGVPVVPLSRARVRDRLARIDAGLRRRPAGPLGLRGLARRAVGAAFEGVGRLALAIAPARRQIVLRRAIGRIRRSLGGRRTR